MTNPRRAAGFTLVETLIALALIALATALIAPNVSRVTGAMGLEGTVDDVARALRLARWQALVGGGTVAVKLDAATRRLIGPTPATSLALPDGVTLEARVAEGQGFVFLADGSASGGRLRLIKGGDSAMVTVDWLTGAVRVEAGASGG